MHEQMHCQGPTNGHNKHGNCHIKEGRDCGNQNMMVLFTMLKASMIIGVGGILWIILAPKDQGAQSCELMLQLLQLAQLQCLH